MCLNQIESHDTKKKRKKRINCVTKFFSTLKLFTKKNVISAGRGAWFGVEKNIKFKYKTVRGQGTHTKVDSLLDLR